MLTSLTVLPMPHSSQHRLLHSCPQSILVLFLGTYSTVQPEHNLVHHPPHWQMAGIGCDEAGGPGVSRPGDSWVSTSPESNGEVFIEAEEGHGQISVWEEEGWGSRLSLLPPPPTALSWVDPLAGSLFHPFWQKGMAGGLSCLPLYSVLC